MRNSGRGHRDEALYSSLPSLWASGVGVAEISERFSCSRDKVRYYVRNLLNLPKRDLKMYPDRRRRSAIEYKRDVWPEKRVQELIRLWRDEMPATAIAGVLGTTRNAIIGKVHRLQLPPRTSQPRKPIAYDYVKTNHRRVKLVGPPLLKRRPVIEPPKPPVTLNLSLLELSDDTCRFPIGDPQKPDFAFCGVPPMSEGRPYCEFHHRLSYQPKRPLDRIRLTGQIDQSMLKLDATQTLPT